MKKTAFLYSEKFGSFFYGANHPMKPVRLRLTHELIEGLGLAHLPNSMNVESRPAKEADIRLFHTHEYLKVLKEANTGVIPVNGPAHGLGFGDNPVFNGVYEWSRYCTGASVIAAELVMSGAVKTAFNIAGGLHHAMPNRASGFCYINDPAVAIKYLVNHGKRVAYVDIDAHHGDGVEYAFYDSDKVLTISLHESGQWIFPGTGFVTDMGIKEGKGYSVNLPFPPGAGDDVFVDGFRKTVPDFIKAFKPDVLVTQLGVDTFESDPITNLSLTTNGFEAMVREFRSFNLPWVALGGGGYDMSNCSRAWTLAWGIMNGVKVPELMPEDFYQKNNDIFRSAFVRDQPFKPVPLRDGEMVALEKDIEFLRTEVLPLVKKGQ
jgi:acetoin utilization protein AcuC